MIWHRIGIGGGHLWIRQWTFGFRKMRGIYQLAEDLSASQEELCSMDAENYEELVTRQNINTSITRETSFTGPPTWMVNDTHRLKYSWVSSFSLSTVYGIRSLGRRNVDCVPTDGLNEKVVNFRLQLIMFSYKTVHSITW
jgi:hypothetical protein